jgi:integrase
MARERWEGGYVHRQKNGQPLYIIEREVGGKRYHVSTRCTSRRAAIKQLERFEANPAAYHPAGEGPEEPLYLTKERRDAFYDWQIAKGVTPKHASEVRGRLNHWGIDLAHVDLRQATLRDHFIPALDRRKKSRGARISTIKAFYGWLREVRHELTSAQDPTLDLMVPQAVPEKWKRRKAVELSRVIAAAGQLAPEYRDLLTVAAATGWHFTELSRFIRQPDSEIIEVKRDTTIAVLVTKHKSREMTRTPVTSKEVLEAAKRIRARGKVPKNPNEKLAEACVAAGVEPFSFGTMRHTVATWAVEAGAVPALVSEFLGHKDPRTLRRFYSDVAVPTAPVALPRLKVVKGGKR